jgi:MFS family permease
VVLQVRELFRRHRLLVTFVVLNSLMGVGVGMAKVATPLYAMQLGADEAMLGLVAGAQSAGVVLMGLPTGFLVDRYGPAGLFVVGSLCAGLLYLVVPLVANVPFLVACTFVISAFMPFRFVTLGTVFLEQLAVWGEGKAGWARGSHMAGTSLLGPALAVSAIQAADYRHAYWVIAGLFLLTMCMSPLVFQQSTSQSSRRALSLADARAQLLMLGRDLDLRAAALIDFVGMGIMNFYTFFIVVIAMKLGLGAEQASGLVGAQGFAYVLALFTLGPLANRLGQDSAYTLSFAAIALALVVLGTGTAPAGLWSGALLLGVGLGILQIVNLMRFARIGARVGRGKIAGLNALIGPAGGLVGGLGGGLIGRLSGLQTVFLLFIPALGLLHRQLSARRAVVALET